MSDATCNGRDVLFLRYLGKRIYMGFLAGTLPMLKFGDWLPTRWVLMGTFAAVAAWLGRHYQDPSAAVLSICSGLYDLGY